MKTFLSLLLCLWTSVAFGVAPVVMSTRGPKTATTIAAVIEALGHRDSTLVFDSGTWALGSDLEFDDNTTLVFLNGAKFAVASGVVVTIAGVVEAGPWPVFTGAGTVAGPYVIRHRWDTWGTATAPESLGPELVATNGWYDTYTGPGAALQLIEGFDFSVAQNIEATPGSVYRVEVSGVAFCNTGGLLGLGITLGGQGIEIPDFDYVSTSYVAVVVAGDGPTTSAFTQPPLTIPDPAASELRLEIAIPYVSGCAGSPAGVLTSVSVREVIPETTVSADCYPSGVTSAVTRVLDAPVLGADTSGLADVEALNTNIAARLTGVSTGLTTTVPESLGPELVATNGWYSDYGGPGVSAMTSDFEFSLGQNITASPGSVYEVDVSGVAACSTGGLVDVGISLGGSGIVVSEFAYVATSYIARVVVGEWTTNSMFAQPPPTIPAPSVGELRLEVGMPYSSGCPSAVMALTSVSVREVIPETTVSADTALGVADLEADYGPSSQAVAAVEADIEVSTAAISNAEDLVTLYGGEWATFAPILDGPVYALAFDTSGRLYVGGDFVTIDGHPVSRLARFNTDLSLDLGFNTNGAINGSVRALYLDTQDRVWFGGDFTTVWGQPRGRMARLSAAGVLAAVNPEFNAGVRSFFLDTNNRMTVGGSYTSAFGVTQRALARLLSDDTKDSSFSGMPTLAPFSASNPAVTAVVGGSDVGTGAFLAVVGGFPDWLPPPANSGDYYSLVYVGYDGGGFSHPDPRVTTAVGIVGLGDTVLASTPGGWTEYAVTTPPGWSAGRRWLNVTSVSTVVATDGSSVLFATPVVSGVSYLRTFSLADTNAVATDLAVFQGAVRTVAARPLGGVVVGGDITAADGAPRYYLAVVGGLESASGAAALIEALAPRLDAVETNATAFVAAAATTGVHLSDTNNPHAVTAAQLGAAAQTNFEAHVGTPTAHGITAAQIGAAAQTNFQQHVDDGEAHDLSAADVGTYTEVEFHEALAASPDGSFAVATRLNEHDADALAHGVTLAGLGAATNTDAVVHYAQGIGAHGITRESLGAATNTAAVNHRALGVGAHGITAASLGALTPSVFGTHTNAATAHGASEISLPGLLSELDFATHCGAKNPHALDITQAEAATAAQISAHSGLRTNPHGVTWTRVSAVGVPKRMWVGQVAYVVPSDTGTCGTTFDPSTVTLNWQSSGTRTLTLPSGLADASYGVVVCARRAPATLQFYTYGVGWQYWVQRGLRTKNLKIVNKTKTSLGLYFETQRARLCTAGVSSSGRRFESTTYTAYVDVLIVEN